MLSRLLPARQVTRSIARTVPFTRTSLYRNFVRTMASQSDIKTLAVMDASELQEGQQYV